MVDNSNIEKLTEPFFPGKSIFAQIWAKMVQNGPQNRVFGYFEQFCHINFSWKYSKMKTNNVIDISPTYLAKCWVSSYGTICCQPIKLQDSFKCNIVRKKWIMKFIFCMQINIEVFSKVILSFWVRISFHIFAISP